VRERQRQNESEARVIYEALDFPHPLPIDIHPLSCDRMQHMSVMSERTSREREKNKREEKRECAYSQKFILSLTQHKLPTLSFIHRVAVVGATFFRSARVCLTKKRILN
jgi:hypothetical protein